MAFFIHVEVESPLQPEEFRDRVVAPLRAALEREGVGWLLEGEPGDDAPDRSYDLAISVNDEDRCRAMVADILRAIDEGP